SKAKASRTMSRLNAKVKALKA
ncbi:hypothetical protein MED297_18258 [Reinekea sp. MED297]|nr:hypothetical protein MED297_18258 [Reinekea sp. MED297] [Reinekea blandensis MED297]